MVRKAVELGGVTVMFALTGALLAYVLAATAALLLVVVVGV